MKIINCGFDYRHPSDFIIRRPHGSGDYILLVLRSPAHFVFDNTTYYTKGNCIVIFKKGTPQLYGAYNAEYINDWVHFELDDADINWLTDLGILFDRILPFNNVSQFSNLINCIFSEKYSNNKNATQSGELYFRLLLLKISDQFQKTIPSNSELFEQLTKLRQDIYSYPQNAWAIDTICKNLMISKSYLQHQYKQLFGTNIKTDITSSRIEHSKYLLFCTNYKIEHISRLCGYENDVHFMRLFKKETGYTPTEYRTFANHSYDKVEESKHHPPYSFS